MTTFRHTPPQARALLVQALRSGAYKRGQGWLRKGDSFCCLGVACEIFNQYEPEHHIEACQPSETQLFRYGGEYSYLPDVVRNWLGFFSSDGELRGGGTLACRNDDGVPFSDIADWIQTGWVSTLD